METQTNPKMLILLLTLVLGSGGFYGYRYFTNPNSGPKGMDTTNKSVRREWKAPDAKPSKRRKANRSPARQNVSERRERIATTEKNSTRREANRKGRTPKKKEQSPAC